MIVSPHIPFLYAGLDFATGPARKAFALGIAVTLGFTPATTRAAFHSWEVAEVYSNPDGTVQFIELRALVGGQQNLGSFSASVTSTNSSGSTTFTCTTNLPSDSANKTCLLGTAALASTPGGVAPNYIIPNGFVRTPVGGGNAAVIFNPNSGASVVYASLPTDGDSALLRSGTSTITVPTNSPRNFFNQSNAIVPVKFLTSQSSGGNFIVTFRTATGTNGTAGPNYAVETNNVVGSVNWSTVSNVAGNGTTKTVAFPLTPATNKFFRLRVP